MTHEDLHPRREVSDEAVALALDILYDLVTEFESTYTHQLRRHYRAQRELRDDRQQTNPPVGDDVDPF
jgi:hypothetical protein